MAYLGLWGLAHLFGILSIILLLVWLLHYRGGIDYDSDNGYLVFNVHPLMMFMGFIFLGGEAMMAFQKQQQTQKKIRKIVHMTLHLIAFILGIVGLNAVFKFHDMQHIPNVYSLHSWIGIGTFCLYGLQWVFGFVAFMLQAVQLSTRQRALPWHKIFGRALLFMAVCAAETGLMEKFAFLNLSAHHRETHLVNFTGLAILLFGVFVNGCIGLA